MLPVRLYQTPQLVSQVLLFPLDIGALGNDIGALGRLVVWK
jgi:hypothetical protein